MYKTTNDVIPSRTAKLSADEEAEVPVLELSPIRKKTKYSEEPPDIEKKKKKQFCKKEQLIERVKLRNGLIHLQKHAISMWKKESDRYEQLHKTEVRTNAKLKVGLDKVEARVKKVITTEQRQALKERLKKAIEAKEA